VNISLGQQYGPLQSNFSIDVPERGYVALTGANNSGKSAVLQLIFRTVMGSIGASHCVLLQPDRSHVAASAETGGRLLEHYNAEMLQIINASPMRFDQAFGPARSDLPKLLLGHTDYITQVNRLNQFLSQLELPNLVLAAAQQLNFNQVPIWNQGAGLRSLLAILAALTDPELQVICIDEPESGLEPRLQRRLKELLVEQSTSRLIVVATHSHLVLDRDVPEATRVVEREGDLVSVGSVGSLAQLHDIVFQLLGNDTSDLFFPGTYLVVEGSSDQALCERALTLLGTPRGQVKVLAAGGLTRVAGTLSAVTTSLTPLVVKDSPYARRVVSMVDRPRPNEASIHAELDRVLGNRLFVLEEESIEAAIPRAWFLAANRDKDADLAQLEQHRTANHLDEMSRLKRAISTQLASVMTIDLLDTVSILREAVKRASALGAPS